MEARLLEMIMSLSTAERAALARHLLDSLEEECVETNVVKSWNREIAARIQSIKRGEYSARDGRESIAESHRILDQEFPE